MSWRVKPGDWVQGLRGDGAVDRIVSIIGQLSGGYILKVMVKSHDCSEAYEQVICRGGGTLVLTPCGWESAWPEDPPAPAPAPAPLRAAGRPWPHLTWVNLDGMRCTSTADFTEGVFRELLHLEGSEGILRRIIAIRDEVRL